MVIYAPHQGFSYPAIRKRHVYVYVLMSLYLMYFSYLGGSMAFYRCGWSAIPAMEYALPLLIASTVGAAVESLPMKDVDGALPALCARSW